MSAGARARGAQARGVRGASSRRATRAVRAAGAALALAAGLAGCARRGPPSGGPPDLTPPFVVDVVPDSGAASVARDARVSVTFSEPMEPRSTGDAVTLEPRVEIRQRRWSGRTLTLVPAETLRTSHTYTLLVGTGARDRHGNTMTSGAAVPFTTGSVFPPGRIEGTLEALGFAAPGSYIWVYHEGRAPDSTARDFDAAGVVDENTHFRVSGLPAPGRYRLWGFADLNRNRSFEPEVDVLTSADTTIALSAEDPVAKNLALRMVNPRAPGRVKGAVIDSTGDTLGVVRVFAIAERDTSRRVMTDADASGTFDLKLDAGAWILRAFRDDDRNRAWRTDVEPASPRLRVEVRPAEEVHGITLRLSRLSGGP